MKIVAALIIIATVFALPAQTQPKSFAYRTSSAQTFSNTLGINCVPAYILMNKVAHQGIFVVSAPTTDLGKKMNLSPGTVLLTVDNYSMISAKAADNWLSHRSKHGPISFTYATDNNGQAQVQSGSVQPDSTTQARPTSTASTSSGVDAHGNRAILSMPGASTGGIGPYMVSLVNKSRAGGGLAALQSDPTLTNFAQSYADYLARYASKYDVRDTNIDPHTDQNGRHPAERAQAAGISNFLNENISRNIGNSGLMGVKIMHDQMMESAGHRPAIMDGEAHLVGIGAAQAGNRLFLVEEFGR